jgi:hypothetical protein
MARRLQLDKLLAKEISTAECRGGSCHGMVSSIEDVDYTSYLWSGVILGGRAIFMPTNFGGPMTDVERLEEASRKRLQAMLALWYGRRSSR